MIPQQPIPQHYKFQDLTGKRFNRLTVLYYAGKHSKRSFWVCRCDCGTVKGFRQSDLKRGETKGCGCLLNPTIDQRLWLRIKKNHQNGCWEWTGAFTQNGYGMIGTNTEGSFRVHRVVYQEVNGPIPTGMCVLHRCDNRKCCNPVHMFLGTLASNTADMVAKGRAPKNTTGVKGKLTEQQVRAIRAEHASGQFTRVQIAEKYGITFETVTAIANRRTWKNIA